MPYDYNCDAELDGCEGGGDVPGLAGQFREGSWLDREFGGIMQSEGYELNDTITICPSCTHRILSE